MGAAGYRRAAALFDLGTQNARLEEIYDQVAESADPGAAQLSAVLDRAPRRPPQ
jgi:hypothetical protein